MSKKTFTVTEKGNMTRKIKILIRGLFIGVVLIGGWLVWSPQVYAGAQEVIITTDKTEYEQGQTMAITVRNSLDKSIWYLDAELGGWNPWWGLQKLEKGNWIEVKVHKPIDGECRIIVREQVPIEELIKELETNAERSDAWTLENCVEVSPIGPKMDLKPLTLGIYRLFFKYGLSKDNYTEKTIYSNEFTIKEKVTQEVTVTTDKTEYKQVETIKITLKNNLKESIFSHIGSGTPIFCIEYIERKTTKGNWEKLLAQGQYPYVFSEKPRDIPKEIKPGQSEIFEWKPLIYINGTSESVQTGSGIYRLVILYQIRKGSSSESWEWKTTKSNEFTIK